MNVLLVQPHAQAQILKKKLLGCELVKGVFDVYSAEQAQALLDSDLLDVAILDMDLLRELGLGLVQRMRAGHPLMRIVALGGTHEVALRVALYELDVDVCLTKPVAPEELLALVTSHSLRFLRLDGRRGSLDHDGSKSPLPACGH